MFEKRPHFGDAFKLTMSLAFTAAPRQFLLDMLIEPLGFVATVVIGFWLKQTMDAAIQHDVGKSLFGAIGFALTIASMLLFQILGVSQRLSLDEKVRLLVESNVAEMLANQSGLCTFEDPKTSDRIGLLRQNQGLLSRGPGMAVVGIAHSSRLIVSGILLSSIHISLLLLPLFGIAPAFAAAFKERCIRSATEQSAEDHRISREILDVSFSEAAAKEIRVTGAGAGLEKRYTDSWVQSGRRMGTAWREAAIWNLCGWAIFGFGFIFALNIVLYRTAAGLASVGAMIMAVYLVTMVAGQLQSVMWVFSQGQQIFRAAEYFNDMKSLLQEASSPQAVGAPAPNSIRRGITLKKVSFKYPQADCYALRAANLHIPAGSIVALLGNNGAGKSTLVKLLLGFYAPTEGSITIDDVDVSKIDRADWWRRCSAVFQDYWKPELLLRQAIGVGDLPRCESTEAVRSALERTGVGSVVEGIDGGLCAQLGCSWGGANLSGGQWQKLAIARSMMRQEPLLFILDEAAASLDAEAEHAHYIYYSKMARSLRARGAITILVSHRLATVAAADLVILVDNGSIVESGSHLELMRLNGRYAKMRLLQSHSYSLDACEEWPT